MNTYRINTAANGIEILFSSKPAEEVRSTLKASGFRWHKSGGYWYAKQTPERLELAKAITESEEREDIKGATTAPKKEKPKVNKFGVKVGDFFSASWGYDQTNNDFFQVIALVGECSVRVREVNPPIIESTAVGSMAEDRVYKLDTSVILPPSRSSVFIKDNEKGDLKRLKSYNKDGKNPQFFLASYTDAHYCASETHKAYESWYH